MAVTESSGDGEDKGTSGARLPLDDRTRFAVEVHFPRAGLAVHKAECIVANFIPFQVPDLSATASSIEEEAYDVGLCRTRWPLGNAAVQFAMQAIDLITREETVELAARIAADTACGVDLKMTMNLRMVQDLAHHFECSIGTARRRCAVVVKPAVHVLTFDPVKWHVTEGRQELVCECNIGDATSRRLQTFIAICPPGTRNEILEQRGLSLPTGLAVAHSLCRTACRDFWRAHLRHPSTSPDQKSGALRIRHLCRERQMSGNRRVEPARQGPVIRVSQTV